MDVGTASALTLYNYQATLKTNGQGSSSSTNGGSAQSAAVLQALTSAYSGMTTSANSMLPAPDALSAMAGSGALGSLMGGIYAASVANGNPTSSFSGLSASLATVGGMDANSASILFGGKGASGSSGAASAINMNASLALASYTNTQNGIANTTIGAAATKAAAKVDSSQPANIQGAIQAAWSASVTSTLNLLA